MMIMIVMVGKKQRLTLIECNNDLGSMMDLAKVADLVCYCVTVCVYLLYYVITSGTRTKCAHYTTLYIVTVLLE